MTEHRWPPYWLRVLRPVWALLLSGVAACAGTPPPDGVSPGEGPCVLVAGTPAGASTLVVALSAPVDPADAPVPRNEAERTVFAQMYQTLVAVDCRGAVSPALAASWDVADQGRRWTFHLRPARAWNGAVVGAADVAQSLAAAGVQALQAVSVVDDRTFSLELAVPVAASFFAQPDLAVAFADSVDGWPMGTGPYRPAPAPAPAFGSAGDVRLVSAAGGVVEFRAMAGDPRNALDAGIDVLVTRDPATIEYAAATGGYRSVPLPWDRVYLLLSPGDPSQDRVVTPTDRELEALARDAVREQARPVPFGTADLETCAPPTVAQRPDTAARPDVAPARTAGGGTDLPSAGDRTIVYPREDAAATALAQRLVALARSGSGGMWIPPAGTGSPLIARGLPDDAFEDALDRGEATAFLFAVRRTAAADRCDLAAEVERRAPWARASGIVPLVETRATALLRDGVAALAGLTVDGTGTLHLRPVPPTEPQP